MLKKISILLKNFKKDLSKRKQLEKENDVLKAKLKLNQYNIINAFIDGNNNTWNLVQVILYDMYKNMEIVDYTSFVQIISKHLTEYDQNKELREEKLKQFNTDLKMQQQLMRGGDANNN